MTTKESLIGKTRSDFTSNRNVGEKHVLFSNLNQFLVETRRRKRSTYLFDKLVSFFTFVSSAIIGETEFVERERDLDVVDSKSSILKATSAKLLGDVLLALRGMSDKSNIKRREGPRTPRALISDSTSFRRVSSSIFPSGKGRPSMTS